MNVEQASAYLKDSIEALENHFNGEDSFLEFGFETRYAIRDYGAILQLWVTNTPSRISRDLFWDTISVEFIDKQMFQKLLLELVEIGFELSTNQIAKVLETNTDIPMYEFHPQRFRAVIPFVKQIGQMALNKETPMFKIEAMQFGMKQFIYDYNQKLQTSPGRFRTTEQRTLTKSVEASMFYGNFVEYGRQIFDFPISLVESFRKSDVEDIPLEAINLPYESFYLHFGAQDDLEMAPGWYPDGAYVSRIGDLKGDHLIQFCLTSINKDQKKYEDWAINHEPFYIQGVSSELMGTGVGEAVDHVLSSKVVELQKQIDSSMQQHIDEALKEINLESETNFKEIADVSSKNAQKELSQLPNKHKVWREMLNLVVNSIAYLTSYQEDIRTEWPKRTPKDLIAHSKEGTPKLKQRSKSKLAALGYTPIHICGTKFVEMVEELDSTSGSGQRKPTWVRGSWVWQPHGPKHSLRRLQWRMPHVRNKDDDIKEDSLGHLYLVS